MTQQEDKPDLVDRFADGLERYSERLKAIHNSPEYLRQRRAARIRGKWFLLCAAIGFPIFLFAIWFCKWMDWPPRIYLMVLVVALGGGIQVAGTVIGNKMVKRDLR